MFRVASHCRHSLGHSLGLLLACFLLPLAASGYELTVKAVDTTASLYSPDLRLNVYVTNPVDSIGGFQLLIRLDRPDLLHLDSFISKYGTVAEDFEFVHAQLLDPGGYVMRITALADSTPSNPPNKRGFGPSPEKRLLLSIPYRLLSIPDTMTERTAHVLIDPHIGNFAFSRPDGSLIGIKNLEIPSQNCYHCNQWVDSICFSWQQVSGPPCDSVANVLDTVPVLDTSLVSIGDGSITVGGCLRSISDIDINSNFIPWEISDFAALADYVMGKTDIIQDPRAADLNGDCRIDWRDVYQMDSLRILGVPCSPEPCVFPCPCQTIPVRKCCWGIRGNVNSDWTQAIDLGDLSALVAYLTTGNTFFVPCLEEANINGAGTIDLGDLSYLVSYLTGAISPPPPCE